MCHGFLRPISACHLIFSPFPQTYQPVLGSHQFHHSPQDGLVCFILFLPATLFAHPFPRPVSQCLAPIKSSAHLKMAWFASSHLRPPPRSPTLPAQGSSTWQAGWQVDSLVVWVLIECESPVTSTHHATHSALLALVVVPPSLFFFVLVCFLGGLEAVNPGQVHSPLAAYLVSFYGVL